MFSAQILPTGPMSCPSAGDGQMILKVATGESKCPNPKFTSHLGSRRQLGDFRHRFYTCLLENLCAFYNITSFKNKVHGSKCPESSRICGMRNQKIETQ